MQRTGDARAFERLLAFEFVAYRHQTGHFGLGNCDFLAAEISELDVGDFVVGKSGFECCVHACVLHSDC
jgi:hypothetical protein